MAENSDSGVMDKRKQPSLFEMNLFELDGIIRRMIEKHWNVETDDYHDTDFDYFILDDETIIIKLVKKVRDDLDGKILFEFKYTAKAKLNEDGELVPIDVC